MFSYEDKNDAICYFEHARRHPKTKRERSDRRRYLHSVLVFETGLEIRGIAIRPEHAYERRDLINWDEDIDFESAEFSDAFFVTSTDRREAYDILTPQTIERLLDAKGYFFQYSGCYLMLCNGKKWEPQEFDRALQLGRDLVSLIPNYIRKENDELLSRSD